MTTWLELTTDCRNLGMAVPDGGRRLAEALVARTKRVAALEIVEGEGRWFEAEMAARICEFSVSEPATQGQWIRLYELATGADAAAAVAGCSNPWPIRNPSALYGKALLKAKRWRESGSVVVLTRADRALVIAPPPALDALARCALATCTFDGSHRAALALMS